MTLRIRTYPVFPTTVEGTGGISVEKSDGRYVVSPSFGDLETIDSDSVSESKEIWVYDPDTEVYNKTSLASVVSAVAQTGAGATFSFLADLDSTTDGDPGQGYLRFNNADQSAATEIYIDDLDVNLFPVSGAILASSVGQLSLTKVGDASKRLIYGVTDVSDESGYTKLTVNVLSESADSPFEQDDKLLFGLVSHVDTYTAPVTGAVARPYLNKFAEQISIRDFLPAADAQTFEVELTQAQAQDISEYLFEGSRTLWVPAGNYIFTEATDDPDTPGTATDIYALRCQDTENVSIIGAGAACTKFFMKAASNIGPMTFNNVWDVLVRGITFDGNRANQTTTSRHGVRIGGECGRITFEDFASLNAAGYGMGFQDSGTGFFKHVKLSNIYIEGCGNDGIDVKNPIGENDDFNLVNVTVKNFAMNEDGSAWRNAEYAGIDIRAPFNATGIRVIHDAEHSVTPGLFITDVSGIRSRSNDAGHKAHISNFYVSLSNNENSSATHATVGVDIESDWCTVVGGHIENCDRALMVTGSHDVVSAVTADSCHLGITGAGVGVLPIFNQIVISNGTGAAINVGGNQRFGELNIRTSGDANEGHWIFAEQGATNLAGLKWTAADTVSWVTTTGSTIFTFPTSAQTGAIYRGSPTSVVALTPDEVWDAMAEVTLTDAATIAVDMSTGFDFTVTLTDNRTLGNPTNVKVGQKGRFRIVQDGSGSRTLAFAANYEFAGGSAIVLSTAINAQDIIYYDCISATRILLTLGGRAIS